MKWTMAVLFSILSVFVLQLDVYAADPGLFRVIRAETPGKGILWLSNTSFYAPISVNTTLRKMYDITNPTILSDITAIEFGLTNHIALSGQIPYYADVFTQRGKSGHKTGPGDITVGIRMSARPGWWLIRQMSIGSRVTVPERLGFGQEPLGFRDFSHGEMGYSVETSQLIATGPIDWYLSGELWRFPKALDVDAAQPSDIFYDSGTGFLGIGKSDGYGHANIIFQDQVTVSFGSVIPVKPWLSGLIEFSATTFTEAPKRDTIISLTPAIHIGRSNNVQFSGGVGLRLQGNIPEKTYMVHMNITSFNPLSIKKSSTKSQMPKDVALSKHSLVAVGNFTSGDVAYLYERELKDTFQKQLSTMGILEVIPERDVNHSYRQMEFSALKSSPERMGIRFGSNFLITANITDYSVVRSLSPSVPYIIGFPRTTFSLSARAEVINLATGESFDLGLVSAQLKKIQGVTLFPCGSSSNLDYLSEPEMRQIERELINRWAENFNTIVLHKIGIFGWEPKRAVIHGDEETSG